MTKEQRAEALRRLANREPLDDVAKACDVSRVEICRLALWALYTKELVLS